MLVTGAAKRIGRAIALALAERGAERRHHLPRLAGRSRADRPRRSPRTTSTPSPSAAICAIPDSITADRGRRRRTTSAGSTSSSTTPAVFESEALEDISVEQWDAMFATNTRAPFLVAQAAHPHLRAAQGRIINIGSLGGIHPWATHAHYCTSKAALHMLSQTMAKAWAPEISVNCVAPGMIVQGEVDAAYEHFAAQDPHAAQRHRRRRRRRRALLRHRAPTSSPASSSPSTAASASSVPVIAGQLTAPAALCHQLFSLILLVEIQRLRLRLAAACP